MELLNHQIYISSNDKSMKYSYNKLDWKSMFRFLYDRLYSYIRKFLIFIFTTVNMICMINATELNKYIIISVLLNQAEHCSMHMS